MIRIDLSEITGMISDKEIDDMIAEEVESTFTDIYTDLTAPPPLGTPIDTGAARNSWQIDTALPLAPEIYTMLPYMAKLNDGHSKQSPEGFIDNVIDKHVRR